MIDSDPAGSSSGSYADRLRRLQYRELAAFALDLFAGDARSQAGSLHDPWEFPDDVHAARQELLSRVERSLPVFGGWVGPGRCVAHVPFLIPEGTSGWALYMLNPAARSKDRHRRQASFVRCCLEDAGVAVSRVVLISVDRSYVRSGAIRPSDLFQEEEVTAWVRIHEPETRRRIDLLSSAEAGGTSLPLCGRPLSCPACRATLGQVPRHHVFTLFRGGDLSRELFHAGILELTDIPDGTSLTAQQRIQLESVRRGEPYVSGDRIAEFLSGLSYPLAFLDFETYSVAVPPFDGVRPWQHVPFQYSVHRLVEEGAELEHFVRIEESGKDGRFEMIRHLLALFGDHGSILVFGSNFERSMINYLGELYPEYLEPARSLSARVVDLSLPFQRFYYYHPEQRGRMSLKMILPALTGTGYGELAFTDGLEASIAYFLSSHASPGGGGVLGEEETARVRSSLADYCAMDTLALVRVLAVLRTAAESRAD